MRLTILLLGMVMGLWAGTASAELQVVQAMEVGYPKETGILFGVAASEEAEEVFAVAKIVLYLMIPVCLFVLGLLIFVAFRFNEKANPVPSRTTHSTILEILWTGIPTLIVIYIGFIGVPQIIDLERTPALGQIPNEGEMDPRDAALDISIHGMPAWNWRYEVNYFGDAATQASNPELFDEDAGGGFLATRANGEPIFAFDSNMLEHPDQQRRRTVGEAEAETLLTMWAQQGRDLGFYQFDVDNRLVIPSGVRIRVNITGPIDTDKQHAWAVPAFAVKKDFWPGEGRAASAHFLVPEGKEGVYFGQCSEFCGAYHAYMPIAVHVVSLDEYRAYFTSQMTAAIAADASGAPFAPEYQPVILPQQIQERLALAAQAYAE